jgi:hypothetical protein
MPRTATRKQGVKQGKKGGKKNANAVPVDSSLPVVAGGSLVEHPLDNELEENIETDDSVRDTTYTQDEEKSENEDEEDEDSEDEDREEVEDEEEDEEGKRGNEAGKKS